MKNNWYGTLTVENCKEVGEYILRWIGDKRYSFVAANEFSGFRPEVRTGQKLENGRSGSPLSTRVAEDGKSYAGFNFCDSYGVWGLNTSSHDEHEYEPDGFNPYLSFEYSKLTIEYRAGAGNKLWWVIALEEEA